MLIGALAVLFSVAVLLESGGDDENGKSLAMKRRGAGEGGPVVSPGISRVCTQVVEPPGRPTDAVAEVSLSPAPLPESVEEMVGRMEPPTPEVPGEADRQDGRVAETSTTAPEDSGGPATTSAPKTPDVYVSEKGDTFWRIAKRFWNRGSEWRTIWEANRDVCPNPDELREGMKIVIPPRRRKATAKSNTGAGRRLAADTTLRPTPGKFYVTRKGDMLSTISKTAYGRASLWRKILEANQDVLIDEYHLVPGMKIFVPTLEEGR